MCFKSFVLLAFLALPGPSCMSSDNIELLISTLKMKQQAACDDEIVSLSCPKGTLINIQVARYGKAVSTQGCTALHSDTEEADGTTCLLPNIMQYKLLQKVVETCQKKPHCNFDTKLRSGTEDPCPSTKKYVEVAYKCRPHEFLSVMACEDQVIKLSCTPYSRIAVMSAQFGRNAHESLTTCPQPPGIRDETCLVPYGVETVMQICHGKRQCEVTANVETFGSSCSVNFKPYLVIAYVCVPLGVLTDKYESADELEEEATSDNMNTNNGRHVDDPESKWSVSHTNTPVANPALQPAHDGSQHDEKDRQPAEVMNEPEESNSKVWVYLGSGVAVFIILLALLFGVRWYISKKMSTTSANDMFSPETPNVFNDVSDIDNDIDVSHISGTFYDPIHPDMMLYRDVQGRGTIQAVRPLSTIYPVGSRFNNEYRIDNSVYRRDKDDPEVAISPKSLGKYSNSQFYYG